MKRFIQEFKEFAIKGNMVDLAVGMIIGSAFTSLVKSVVDNLFMPILSIFTGKLDFTNMFIPLAGQTTKIYSEAVEQGAVFAYGAFLTELISFLVMALVVFLFVKEINHLRKPKAEPTSRSDHEDLPVLHVGDRREGDPLPALHLEAGGLSDRSGRAEQLNVEDVTVQT